MAKAASSECTFWLLLRTLEVYFVGTNCNADSHNIRKQPKSHKRSALEWI
jgi:hypothetical protein